ncbi:tyrosine-type recombinase/integrase [Pseudobacillus sp. FSL P4-0506]|uniref:tyrosine-type recombinase/integrase n=1 Tax=Pseudobacillus sp. FSL P4-0506 TaxID=2921576 RepID=UPI0030FCD79C
MPRWYMGELKDYYREWRKEKLALGDQWQGGDRQFIFHCGLGIPYYPARATINWIKFRDTHGLNIRLHDLRHTMVTLLTEEGVNSKAIQQRAGHSSSKITSDVYGHITKKVLEATA